MIVHEKKLAVFLPGLYGGGCERAMLNLIGGFVRRGLAVDLVVAEAVGPYLDQIPGGVRLVELNPRRLRRFRTLASLPLMARYLRRERPCALLSALHATIIGLWARRLAGVRVRTVLSEQNTFSFQNRSLGPLYRRLFPALTRLAYPSADAIVAVSRGAAEDLAKIAHLPIERVQVIPNPIVTPELQEKAAAVPDHPWFGPGEPPVILAIGRLAPQKDFPTLIHAFAGVRKRHAVRLLILGEGPDRPELEGLIRQLGLQRDVGMPGFVRNPYAFLSRSALFVLSSRWEGLPTVVVEALYCKTPVISTDCPSGPREILADGRFGKLVPVGEVAKLEQAMSGSLSGECVRPPEESWSPYTLDATVDRYLQLLRGNL